MHKDKPLYIGVRDNEGRLIVAKVIDPRNDLLNHSPDGLEVGYNGSGPAQTALAICADYLGDDTEAVKLHQVIKADLIAKLPQDRQWIITEEDLQAAIAHI